MSSIPTSQYPLEDSRMEKQTVENDKVDRISQLPDSILHQILSYLPTIYAVGTSILSTRWKNLFASMPNHNLVFHDSLILHPKRELRLESSASSRRFVQFVSRVLAIILLDVAHHRNILPDVSYVNSFSLNCEQDHGDSHINTWIHALELVNVQELSLNIDVKYSNLLHNSLFGCNSVVKLSLGYNITLRVPDLVYFPNLKYLNLNYVKFMDGDSFQRILNGCPVLEDFQIYYCEWEDMEILIISVHSLKRLDIRNETTYEILLDTPTLEYFFCYGYLPESKVDNMSFLLDAHLDVGPSEDQWEEEAENFSRFGRKVAKLVTACSNVEFLYLSGPAIEGIHDSGYAMPTFHKLTQLTLGGMGENGWKLLPQLLERSTNLEVLVCVFTRGFSVGKNCYPIFENYLPENVPICLSLHLREIGFVEFKGEFDELMLVEYFLNTSKVLRKLEISTCMSSEMLSWISEKILMLPRCSKSCKIVLKRERC